jgi:hypothetical protein
MKKKKKNYREIHTVALRDVPKCLDKDLNLEPFDPEAVDLPIKLPRKETSEEFCLIRLENQQFQNDISVLSFLLLLSMRVPIHILTTKICHMIQKKITGL